MILGIEAGLIAALLALTTYRSFRPPRRDYDDYGSGYDRPDFQDRDDDVDINIIQKPYQTE